MPTTEAEKRATNKYRKKTYDTISCDFKKGQKELIRDLAAEKGESVQGFIRTAVEQRMKRIRNREE